MAQVEVSSSHILLSQRAPRCHQSFRLISAGRGVQRACLATANFKRRVMASERRRERTASSDEVSDMFPGGVVDPIAAGRRDSRSLLIDFLFTRAICAFT